MMTKTAAFMRMSAAVFRLLSPAHCLAPSQDAPHNSIFSNGGLSLHAFDGWAVGEISFSSNRWSGGNETRFALTSAYVWRLAKRSELLVGIPIGLTSSTDRVGAVIKFTFELGGRPD